MQLKGCAEGLYLYSVFSFTCQLLLFVELFLETHVVYYLVCSSTTCEEEGKEIEELYTQNQAGLTVYSGYSGL